MACKPASAVDRSWSPTAMTSEMAKVLSCRTQVEVQILVLKKYSGKSRSTDLASLLK